MCGNGFQLAVINSEEDNEFIYNLAGLEENVWIGLFKETSSRSSFAWVDGSKPTSFNKWGRGQPNNIYSHNNEHQECGAMEGPANSEPRFWNDLGCSIKLYFICQEIR